METSRIITITCFLVACVFPLTGALYCYQCGSAGSDGYCIANGNDLAKSASKVLTKLRNSSNEISDGSDTGWTDEGITIPYIKLCNGSKTTCIIEEVQNSQTSGVLSYIRDCSDGKSFSYENMTMLRDLQPNNFSTCAYDVKGYLICLSLCNTDFCNGPHTTAGASSIVLPIVLNIVLQAVSFMGVGRMLNLY